MFQFPFNVPYTSGTDPYWCVVFGHHICLLFIFRPSLSLSSIGSCTICCSSYGVLAIIVRRQRSEDDMYSPSTIKRLSPVFRICFLECYHKQLRRYDVFLPYFSPGVDLLAFFVFPPGFCFGAIAFHSLYNVIKKSQLGSSPLCI